MFINYNDTKNKKNTIFAFKSGVIVYENKLYNNTSKYSEFKKIVKNKKIRIFSLITDAILSCCINENRFGFRIKYNKK